MGENLQAIYHKTPIIGIPVFGDQPDNVAKAVYRGIGLGMPPGRITADALAAAIIQVAEQPQYREAVTKLSKRMRAHRSTPVQQAGGESLSFPCCALLSGLVPCSHLCMCARKDALGSALVLLGGFLHPRCRGSRDNLVVSVGASASSAPG